MGRKSREKRERRTQRTAARRQLPTDSEAPQHIAYCAACGGITMGMQARGLYEGLIFDVPQACPTCDQQ